MDNFVKFGLIVLGAVVGAVLFVGLLVVWLITTYIPMPAVVKNIIYVVVAVAAVLWVLSMIPSGTLPPLHYHRH